MNKLLIFTLIATSPWLAAAEPFPGRLVVKNYGGFGGSEHVVIKSGREEREIKNGSILEIAYKEGPTERVVARMRTTALRGTDGFEIDQVFVPLRVRKKTLEVVITPEFARTVSSVTLLGFVGPEDAPRAHPEAKNSCAYFLKAVR